MKLFLSPGWSRLVRSGALGITLIVSPLAVVAFDNKDIGLDPVYPKLSPNRTKLVSDTEMPAALAKLPGWQHRDGILFKIYPSPNFMDAIALIVRISYPIQHLDHHPEIRNIYGKVYVGFTTYDQGKKVTTNDVEAALLVEAAATGYPLKGAAAH